MKAVLFRGCPQQPNKEKSRQGLLGPAGICGLMNRSYARRSGTSVRDENGFDAQADARLFGLVGVIHHDKELAVRGGYPEERPLHQEVVEVYQGFLMGVICLVCGSNLVILVTGRVEKMTGNGTDVSPEN